MQRCRVCKSRVQGLDFYFKTPEGPVCSSCMVLETAAKEVVALLRQTEARPEQPPRKQPEMSLGEVRRAVWS